jgi:hypothetical protein
MTPDRHGQVAPAATKAGKPRLGVVLLQADHAVETLDAPDPFHVPAPPGMPPTFFGHPDFWPVPTAFAVARDATGSSILELDKQAVRSVIDAIGRLAPLCDLIVGSCGYFVAALPFVTVETPLLLSSLQLLDAALRSSSRPLGVLTYNRSSTEKILADHPERDRLRVVGLDHMPAWGTISRPDWITARQWTEKALRTELLEICERERRGGALRDIGGIVLECTALPQFRSDIFEVLLCPVWDVSAIAKTLLGS